MGKEKILEEWLDKGNNEYKSAEYLSTMRLTQRQMK